MPYIKYKVVSLSETNLAGHDAEGELRRNVIFGSRHRLLVWLNGFIFCLSLFLFTVTASLIWSDNGNFNDLLRKTSEHSPIFDHIDIPLITRKVNATLVEPNPLPIYHRPHSPEVDAAWNRLANIKPIVISRSDVVQLGRDPSMAAKWPESFGFGSEAYICRIDVFHQIHCLDWLRREANFDHYYGRKWPPGTQTSDMHRTHASHCIYLLLQNLMCNVDIYTHYWSMHSSMHFQTSASTTIAAILTRF